MRRRRHQLQVDTFPFLAVLLAAMGALILFLFIMDRRAKIVARNKALEEATARRTERDRETERRRQEALAAAEKERDEKWQALVAEREEQRRRIENDLRQRHQELQAKLSNLRQAADLSERKVAQEAFRLTALVRDLEREEDRLRREGKDLAGRLQELEKADLKKDAVAQERERLTQDLLRLEKALQGLQQRRLRQGNTFSLVPYRGRRGAARRPVYIECTTLGLVFQPEGKRLSAWDLDPAAFRREVERRGVEVEREKPPAREPTAIPLPPPPSNGPYVLFLVRPDGLESYYEAMGALRGYAVDFGYELIDGDMALDFSADKLAGLGGPPDTGGPGRPGLAFGPGGPGGPGGTGNSNLPGTGLGQGNGPREGNGPGRGGTPWRPGGTGIGPYPLGSPGAGGSENGGNLAGRNGPVLGAPIGGPFGSVPGTGGNSPGGGSRGGPVGVGLGTPTSRPPFGSGPGMLGTGVGTKPGTEGRKSDPPGPGGGSTGPEGNGPGPGPGNSEKKPPGHGSGSADGTGTAPVPGSFRPVPPPTGTAPGSRENGRPGPRPPEGKPGDQGSTPTAGEDPWRTAGPLTGKIEGKQDPTDQRPVERPEGPRPDFVEGGGGAGDGTPGMPGGRGPRLPARPSSLGSLLANRDYRVTLICTEDALYVLPGGRTYSMKTPEARVDRQVVEHVVGMIARRQSGVRPGEPPFRPLLRFQVHPAGLRTYYRVYPLFENLKIPMTRENVD